MSEYTAEGFHYTDPESRPHPAAAKIWSRIQPAPGCALCSKKYWVLDYSVLHDGEVQVDEHPWQERPAHIAHLYPPGRIYRERRKAGKIIGAYFLFSGEDALLRQLVENSRGFARIGDPEGLLLECIRRGARAAARGNRGYWQFAAAFADAMELLANRLIPGEGDWEYRISGTKKQCLPLGESILEFLEQHYREHFTMKQLAEHFNCSQSTLTHKFRETYGESIWERLLKIRVEQSVPLLEQGETLKEIAGNTGFANEFYYSKMFKKIHSVSPREYRKKTAAVKAAAADEKLL